MLTNSDRITELQELKDLLVEWGYAEKEAREMAILLIFDINVATHPSLGEG